MQKCILKFIWSQYEASAARGILIKGVSSKVNDFSTKLLHFFPKQWFLVEQWWKDFQSTATLETLWAALLFLYANISASAMSWTSSSIIFTQKWGLWILTSITCSEITLRGDLGTASMESDLGLCHFQRQIEAHAQMTHYENTACAVSVPEKC